MNEQTRQVYLRGKEAFAHGDFRVAEICLTHVLNKHRDFADVFALLGSIYHEKGRFGDAIRLFEKAIEINPHYEEARLQLAVMLNDLGFYDQARKVLSPLLDAGMDPDSLAKHRLSNRHAELGDQYMEVNQFDRARAEYKRALSIRPQFHDIRRKLAISLRRLNRLHESREELEKILEEKPDYSQARVDLGLVLLMLGETDWAREQWEAVLNQEPENEEAKTFLAATDVEQARAARV